jgi:hypothetical protein
MKKFSVYLAIAALLLASLACQTVMGGGSGNSAPDTTAPGYDSGTDNSGATTVPEATSPSVETDGNNVTVGGGSPFPVATDAFNVVSTPTSVTYQTKLSADDMMKFYRDELGAQGYTEDTSLTTNFSGIVAMFFKGSDGKDLVLAIAPVGDGSNSVTVSYQQ